MTAPNLKPLVAYYRVSTQRQGVSGLGLDAQRTAVHRYATERGLELIGEFTEVESGRKTAAERPVLRDALRVAQQTHAALVVAKLDRLARDAAFVLNLRAAGVEFVACDCPFANRMVLGILAVVAEYEAEQISERTKAALAAAKARGKVLGGDRGGRPDVARQAAADSAARRRDKTRKMVEAAWVLSDYNMAETARSLNDSLVPTPSGRGAWHPQTIDRYIQRGELAKPKENET